MSDTVSAGVIRFFRAVDTRDWAGVGAGLDERVAVDYTSLFGGTPQEVSRADLLTGWQALLPGFDATQHLLGALLVEPASSGDGWAVRTNVRAYHRLDGQTWMVAGWYDLQGRTLDDRAVLGMITLTVSYETGDRALVDEAARRASS